MRNENKALKRSIIAVAVISIVTIGIGFWWKSMNEMPVVKIPIHPLPNPNGYDYFVNAAKMMKDKRKIGIAANKWRKPSSYDPSIRVYSPAEKDALVKENAQSLDMVRLGLNCEYWAPVSGSLPRFNTGLLDLTRLLEVKAQAESARGGWGEAMNTCLDGIEMGIKTAHGADIYGAVEGISNQASVRQDAWQIIEHLNDGQARSAARRLEDIVARRVSLSATLEEEKWRRAEWYLQMMSGNQWHNDVIETVTTGSGTNVSAVDKIKILNYSKKRLISEYISYMDRAIAATGKQYPAMKIPAQPKGPILQLEIVDCTGLGFIYAKAHCQNQLLLVTLALRAYRLDYGSYPARLSELAPTYLKRLPDDPFAMSGPYKYKFIHNSYTLYSVGPDGKDDGGKPCAVSRVPSKSPWKPEQYPVKRNSKGDMVGGVNVR